LFLAGGIISGYLAPSHPSASAAQTARHYAEHSNSIRVGLLLWLFSGGLWLVWSGVLAAQMLRIRGAGPLACIQVAGAACSAMAICIPPYFWLTAAYRPRTPEIQQTLHDMGWLPFDGSIMTVIWQNIAIGVAVLIDRRETPIFPRWYAYLSFWSAVLYLPACLDVFFKHGPFAWNGVLAWYLVMAALGVWLVCTFFVLLGAIRHQESEETLMAASQPSDDLFAQRLAALEERLAIVGPRL
jgi:hypothetical protein